VPFVRPAKLSDDHATTADVMRHATQWAQAQGWPLKAVCCIYPTAPFLGVSDIQRGLEALESGTWEYAFSATEYAAPIFRSFKVHRNGGVEMFFPEYFSTRSQDLPEAMHDAAQFYWGRPSAWLESKTIFARHSTPVVIPRWRVQDIDNEDDWVRAETIAPLVMGKRLQPGGRV
jgi:N-acylneuraminate cytidylyltransferase